MIDRNKEAEKLIGMMEWMLKKHCTRYGLFDYYDELYGAGLLAITKSLNGYNPDLGFKISTFAYHAIKWELYTCFRKIINDRRLKTISLDNQLEEVDSDFHNLFPDTRVDIEREVIANENKELVNKLLNLKNIHEIERTIIKMIYFEGKSYMQVAEELNITHSKVKSVQTNVIGKLRRYVKNHTKMGRFEFE